MKISGEDLLCAFCGSDELGVCVVTGQRSVTAVYCTRCGATWAPTPPTMLFACIRGPKPVTIVGELARPEIEAR